MINGLDLFSGIGGLSLSLAPWVRPVAFCESERYAQSVLLSRMQDGSLPRVPIWDDVRTLSRETLRDVEVDIIYGGFPCQDISVAGLGAGLEGERSGLVREIFRLLDEIRPVFLFLENVPAIRTRGAYKIGLELSDRGYDCRWDVISAAEVGAPHLRKRWFLLAHANHERSQLDKNKFETSDTDCEALRKQSWGRKRKGRELQNVDSPDVEPWITAWTSQGGFEPRISRAGNGIPCSVERDKALGNAVVPLQAREAFKRLMYGSP